MIELHINGERRSVAAAPTSNLLDVLRNELGLTGTRFGCGAWECGACVVLVGNDAKAACQVEIGNIKGAKVTTLEGIGTPEHPHPLQTAFLELQAGQCGYCLSGIIVASKALLDRNPKPSRAEIAAALNGHLCRCGVQNRIMDAVLLAASLMAGARS